MDSPVPLPMHRHGDREHVAAQIATRQQRQVVAAPVDTAVQRGSVGDLATELPWLKLNMLEGAILDGDAHDVRIEIQHQR